MSIKEIDNRLKKILSTELLVNKKKINSNSSSKNIANWDSLRHMSVINAIESEFSIYFENEDIVEMSNFDSIKNKTIKYLKRKNK